MKYVIRVKFILSINRTVIESVAMAAEDFIWNEVITLNDIPAFAICKRS